MTTFEYIMNKREKAIEIEERIKDLEEQIRIEEEKISRDNLPTSRSQDKPREMRNMMNNEQRTKSSCDYPNETSKGSLLPNGIKSHRQELEGSKEDDIFHLENESYSKENPDNDMGFRITATSNFHKNNAGSTSHPNENSQEWSDYDQNTNSVSIK